MCMEGVRGRESSLKGEREREGGGGTMVHRRSKILILKNYE